MRPGVKQVLRSLAALMAIALLWILLVFLRPIMPDEHKTLVLPAVVLFAAMLLMPRKMASPWRLTATAGVFALLLLATRIQQGYMFRTWLFAIASCWGAGQILLVVIAERVRAGKGTAWMQVLHDRGYFTLLVAVGRGDFGMSIARTFAVTRVAGFILIGTMLLFRAGSLDDAEDDIVFSTASWERSIDSQYTAIVTLHTPDNNTIGYLRTALELQDLFRAAGAGVICYPLPRFLDPESQRLKDSLEAQGAIMSVQGRAGWSVFNEHWGNAYSSFSVTGLSWQFNRSVPHPGLLAVAKFKGVSVVLPKELLRPPPFDSRQGGVPDLSQPYVTIGETVIPVSDDGTSAILNPWGKWGNLGGRGRWDYFRFPAGVCRNHWDSSITYMNYTTAERLTSLPDSAWHRLNGKMVFLEWFDMGGDEPHGGTWYPAMIAEMVMNGMIVTKTESWALPMSCLILVIAAFLSWGGRIWPQATFLVACAAGALVLDAWLFREFLLVTRLIYPAFTAAVAAIVVPLVMMAKR
jgi:hypothetical protein